MRRRNYTFLILSDDRDRFRRLHFTSRTLWGAGAAVVGLIVLLAAGGQLLLRSRTLATDLVALRAENATLRTEKSHYDATLSGINGRLNRFEVHAQRMASELGIEDLDTGSPAAGGPGSAVSAEVLSSDALVNRELSSLAGRSAGLDESLAELDRVFQQRIQLLAATPNAIPVQGWFSHGFGWRKDPWTGEREFHRGIDIVADHGTPIEAPADGVVSRTARVSDYGNVVDISHGHGYVTRYAHLSEVAVEAGQRVGRGDIVGRVGTTGRSTGPHLHYEVFRDGRRVNPWKYLGQR